MNQQNMADQQQRIGQRIQNLRPVQKLNEFQQGIAGRPPTEKEMQTGERLSSRLEANPRFQQLQERANGIGQKQMQMQMSAPQMQQTQMPQGNMGPLQVAQEQLNSPPPGQGQMQTQAQAQALQNQMQNQSKMGNAPMSASPLMQTPMGMPQQVGGMAARAMGLGAPMGAPPPPPMGGMGGGMGAPPMGGAPAPMGGAPAAPMGMKKGGRVKAYAKGGTVSSKPKASSAASRGDGCAQRGKTKGRFI